jgi:hypothetical protein
MLPWCRAWEFERRQIKHDAINLAAARKFSKQDHIEPRLERQLSLSGSTSVLAAGKLIFIAGAADMSLRSAS